MEPLWYIAAVMLASGVLGGLINFFITDPQDERRMKWWQHVVVGIGASFMVPLFLNMISGDLIDKIRGAGVQQPPDYSKLFVLAGFCLVAAVSSRAFIHTLSERILKEARSAKKEAREAKEQATDAKAAVAPFVEEDESSAESAVMTKSIEQLDIAALNDEERAVLHAMISGKYSMRSISGISKDASLEKSRVNAVITSLMSKGLVSQGTNLKGQPRWYPSSAGRLLATRLNG